MKSILLLAILFIGASFCNLHDEWRTYQENTEDQTSYRPEIREEGAFFFRTNGDLVSVYGLQEAIRLVHQNVFFVDVSTHNFATNKWTRIHYGNGTAPSARAFFCWGYDAINDVFYLNGGTNYLSATVPTFAFYNDTWKFEFSTNTWTQLTLTNFPSSRASSTCGTVGQSLFLFSGAIVNQFFVRTNFEDFWHFNMSSETWSLISTNVNATGGPIGRAQGRMTTLISTTDIWFSGGSRYNGAAAPTPLDDVWLLHADNFTWEQLDNEGTPFPVREFPGVVATSDKFVFMIAGDAQGNKTVADTCAAFTPPGCFVPATPTNNMFIYNVNRQKWTEFEFDEEQGNISPLRRPNVAFHENQETIYLYGGFNWVGNVPIGVIRNPEMKYFLPRNKYTRLD
ncbi:Hypothetical protein KVN_LOCUS21 [uncultured virus]|nr:Hypothetical protein KVN_LOCUS21 [uncultured virus]